MTSLGQRLRELIEAPELLVLPGIHEGFSARLVEAAGFKAAALPGAGTSDSRLGWADTGIMAGKEAISAEEGVEKIRAACEARRDPSFVIKSRTDATAIFGVGEAIGRLNPYAEAGVDLLFADALLSARGGSSIAPTCWSGSTRSIH